MINKHFFFCPICLGRSPFLTCFVDRFSDVGSMSCQVESLGSRGRGAESV